MHWQIILPVFIRKISHSIAVKSQQCHQLFKHLNPAIASYFSLETAEELRILLVHEQELLEEAHALQRIFDTEADDTVTD